MYRSLHHFIVLIMIIHALWYDTRQENNYFITKVIDKRKKKNKNVVDDEDWTHVHLKPVSFRS